MLFLDGGSLERIFPMDLVEFAVEAVGCCGRRWGVPVGEFKLLPPPIDRGRWDEELFPCACDTEDGGGVPPIKFESAAVVLTEADPEAKKASDPRRIPDKDE